MRSSITAAVMAVVGAGLGFVAGAYGEITVESRCSAGVRGRRGRSRSLAQLCYECEPSGRCHPA
jgi:hypothetical protein